jgi:hypothetical protein
MVALIQPATRITPDMKTIIVLATLLLCALPALSVAADKGIPWNTLDRNEQSVLRKHRGHWSNMGPGKQNELRHGARKYLDLRPQERQTLERKQKQYRKMSPGERKRLREHYKKHKRSN